MTVAYGQVYLLTNLVNGKQYVGQTTMPLRRRLNGHNRRKAILLIGRAVRKYGLENFRVEVVALCSTQEELDAAETAWIARLGTAAPNGYNVSLTGGRGPVSAATRARMSDAAKRRQSDPVARANHKAAMASTETKTKLSAARRRRLILSPELIERWVMAATATAAIAKRTATMRGKPPTAAVIARRTAGFTTEVRKRMSERYRQRLTDPAEYARWYAAHHSPAVHEKIAAKKRGTKHTPETRAKMSAAHQRRLAEKGTS